ncbi:hypothetical protein PRIPAC_88519 [Pristionchus pacificus]|uniref:Uncharacterized protein n=1 Tax=Pristionchus pacificus TaxID=54126 RepID=A0A2A6B8J5_PRIPA|nr:hypothetical protein PRIPAC_88519 [Pristionchus pacificus]|eukprot:PDM62194.1 hypothetical protein PRIPAC_51636 [Pristionchus pacificus]
MHDTSPLRRRRSTGARDDVNQLAVPSTSTPSIPCPDCERFFDSSKAMKVHVFRSHTVTSTSVSCPHCERTFDSSPAMRVHVFRSHKSLSVVKESDGIAPNSEPTPISKRESLRNAALGKRKASRRTIGSISAQNEHVSVIYGKSIEAVNITISASITNAGNIGNDCKWLYSFANNPKRATLEIKEFFAQLADQTEMSFGEGYSIHTFLFNAVTTPEESLSNFHAMIKSRRSGNAKTTPPSPISNSPCSSTIARTSSSEVKSNTPVSIIRRSPTLNNISITATTERRPSISPLAMSNLSLNKSAKFESSLSSTKATPTPLTETPSPFTLSTLSLNGSARSRLGGPTTTPRAHESSPSSQSSPISGAEKAAIDAKKTVRQKLIEISGQKIKQCFESTKSFAGFRNIFTEEEIESIKESIIDYRRSRFTRANNAWTWKTEEKTTIECDVKAQMSVCIKEQLKKRPRIWNDQIRRFAPHNCEAISQAAYLLDFAVSSDMKSFVYFIDIKEMLKCGRGWTDESNKEDKDARAIVEEKMSILKGGLEQEDMDLWTSMIKKTGSNTLTLDEYIKPKDMDQWVLHRMRRKEMKEHPNLQIWESVLAEMEVSKMVDRRMKEVLRALVD